MPKIEPHISKYIDSSIDKAITKAKKGFGDEFRSALKINKKEFGDDVRSALKVSKNEFGNEVRSALKIVKSEFSDEVRIAIKTASKEFGDEIRGDFKGYTDELKRHNSALVEHIDNHMNEFHRVVSSLPTESSVREIFREEIHPFDLKLNLCVSEIGQLNTKMDGVLAITNNHEERISSLELEAV
jgi:hypothetical protein